MNGSAYIDVWTTVNNNNGWLDGNLSLSSAAHWEKILSLLLSSLSTEQWLLCHYDSKQISRIQDCVVIADIDIGM